MDQRALDLLSYVTTAKINSQSTLLEVLQTLSLKRTERLEADIVGRLLNSQCYVTGNDVVTGVLRQIHKSHEAVVEIWNILAAEGSLSSGQASFIISLFETGRYFHYNERLLANLLLSVHTRNRSLILPTLVDKLSPFVRKSFLIPCILASAVCSRKRFLFPG